jgi:hypothetical protein
MVQGVVVQIRTEATSSEASRQTPPASSRAEATGNRTQIMWEVVSWYSTSASARAVFSTGLHMTGLEPW